MKKETKRKEILNKNIKPLFFILSLHTLHFYFAIALSKMLRISEIAMIE